MPGPGGSPPGWLGVLDLENLAEEIESLGNEQPLALRAAYRILLVHLLIWLDDEFWPEGA